MAPSEFSLEAQRRTLDDTSRRKLPSQPSPALHSPSYLVNRRNSVLFESTKTQIEVSSMAAEVTPITKLSVHQKLSSSSVSDLFQGTKYFTSEFNFTKDKNCSETQDKTTAPSVPINAKGYFPKFFKDHISSLPFKNVSKLGNVSSQIVSSEAAVTSSHNSLSSDHSTDISSVQYPHAVHSSVFQHQNPCPLSDLVLCKSLEEDISEVAASYSSFTDLNATNSSNLSLSLASSASSDVASVTTQSERHSKFSKSSVSVHVSKFSDNERKDSSERNMISKSTSLLNPLLLSELTRDSETHSSENSTFDSIKMPKPAFWKLSHFEDQTYWSHMHRNTSARTSRTLTPLRSLSLVRSYKTTTSRTRPSSEPRSIFRGSDSSDHLERITVLGLFEMTTRTGERMEGRSELAAARLAVSHINEKRLLPGYQLELITNDTKVTSAVSFISYSETCFRYMYS
jgi:hypothetical protein